MVREYLEDRKKLWFLEKLIGATSPVTHSRKPSLRTCAEEDRQPLSVVSIMLVQAARFEALSLFSRGSKRDRRVRLEDNSMCHPYRYISALLLASILAAPISIMAAAKAQSASIQVRVYDKSHKDYHNWDDHENRAWGTYLSD